MTRPERHATFVLGLCLLLCSTSVSGHESTLHAYQSAVLRSGGAVAGSPCEMALTETCQTNISLLDAATGESVAGLLRVDGDNGCRVPLDPLLDRGTELAADHDAHRWSVLLEPTEVALPRTIVTLEAFSGLETEMYRQTINLEERCPEELTLRMRRFYDAGRSNWHSGNTHLHIRNLTRQESDRYLTTIPKGDDLDLVFVTFLERIEDDKTYISNEYMTEDLLRLSSPGVGFGWGEELRHYFGPYGEGYGHVLLLNLQKLVRPVSIGPGLTGKGDDGIPVRQGMLEARHQGGSVVWCHNTFGFEDVPNWLDGVIDAQNIFDGGSEGSYEDGFYHYLNIGLRVPFSTGTDWFMYDFSRVYVISERQPSVSEWLQALAAGKSFITNGTFLELSLASNLPGDLIELQDPTSLPVKARAVGRNDFGSLELVFNGSIIDRAKSRKSGGTYEVSLEKELRLDRPGWLAARIADAGENELGEDLFAHTSPIYIEISGERVFDPVSARALLREMEQAITTIPSKAVFSKPSQWEMIRRIYDQGVQSLKARLP